jgi:DNA-binding PadR family transcriptional regulator
MRLFSSSPGDSEARRRALAAIGDGGLSGFEVARALSAGRDEAGVYPTLHRLEADGHLRAAWLPNASGATRRTYRRTRRLGRVT